MQLFRPEYCWDDGFTPSRGVTGVSTAQTRQRTRVRAGLEQEAKMNPPSEAKQHDAPSSTENTTDECRNGPSTPGARTDASTSAIHRGTMEKSWVETRRKTRRLRARRAHTHT